MCKYLDRYEVWMITTFGYEWAVRLEEIILILAVFALAVIITTYIFARFLLDIHSIEKNDKSELQVTPIQHENRQKYIIKVGNVKEAFEHIWVLVFAPFFTIKSFGYKDAKRTRRFLRIICVVVVLLFVFALLSICTMFEPL